MNLDISFWQTLFFFFGTMFFASYFLDNLIKILNDLFVTLKIIKFKRQSLKEQYENLVKNKAKSK